MKKFRVLFLSLLILGIFISACSGSPPTPQVEETATVIAVENTSTPQATSTMVEVKRLISDELLILRSGQVVTEAYEVKNVSTTNISVKVPGNDALIVWMNDSTALKPGETTKIGFYANQFIVGKENVSQTLQVLNAAGTSLLDEVPLNNNVEVRPIGVIEGLKPEIIAFQGEYVSDVYEYTVWDYANGIGFSGQQTVLISWDQSSAGLSPNTIVRGGFTISPDAVPGQYSIDQPIEFSGKLSDQSIMGYTGLKFNLTVKKAICQTEPVTDWIEAQVGGHVVAARITCGEDIVSITMAPNEVSSHVPVIWDAVSPIKNGDTKLTFTVTDGEPSLYLWEGEILYTNSKGETQHQKVHLDIRVP